MKKGQLTVFVLLGLFILLVTVGYLYFTGAIFSSQLDAQKAKLAEVPSQFLPVRSVMEQCATEVALDARTYVFLRGAGEEGVYVQEFDYSVAYWHDGVAKTVPSLDAVEDALSAYLVDHYLTCVDDFSLLDGFTFDGAAVAASAEIGPERLVFVVDYPIKVGHKGVHKKMPAVVAELDSSFVTLYTAAETLLDAPTSEVDLTSLMQYDFEANAFVVGDAVVYAFFTQDEGVMFARAI